MFPTLSYFIKHLTGLDVNLPLPTFGFFMAIAFVVAYYLYRAEFKRNGIRPQLMDHVIFYCGIAGLAGAFLFQKLESIQQWIHHPIPYFFQFDGMVWYGGLIFGILTALWLAKKYKIGLMNMMDMGTGPLMLAYAIGRLGCYFSGDGDWGIINTYSKPAWIPGWAWADTFPHNILNAGDPIPECTGRFCKELPVAVFPTSLYEALACILIFMLLWAIRKRLQVGWLFGIYCVLNGVERFSIEQIRLNPVYHFGGLQLSQAMIIGLGFVATGMVVMAWAMLRQRSGVFKKQIMLT